MKIAKYIILSLSLLTTFLFFFSQYKSVKNKNKVLVNNYKALLHQRDSILSNNIVFLNTIEDLQSSRDSVDSLLLVTANKLKIKETTIRDMTYSRYIVSKTDTITLRDTIFNYDMDTLLQNEFYKLKVSLKYPDSLIINPTFTSEKLIYTHYKKVWINRPKCWITRLFTKKSKIIEIKVVDTNPYITNNEIKIIDVIN